MATGRVPTTANSPLTAKGDLFGYSTTQARVAVGNDGETLVADSSTSVGIRYQGNYAAGKNKLINGDMGIWQRGTSVAVPANNDRVFQADRFWAQHNGTTNGTVTYARQSFTAGQTDVPNNPLYFARVTNTTLGTSQTQTEFGQFIEDVTTFAGQTATFSFYVKASGTFTLTGFAYQNFGSGGSSNVFTTLTLSTSTTTTSWQRITATLTVPSVSGKTIGAGNFISFYIRQNTPTAGSTIDFSNWQVEAGSVATAFQTATGTLQGELAACRRYLPAVNLSSGVGVNLGYAYGTNAALFVIPFDVVARTQPTGISIPTVSGNFTVRNSTNGDASATTMTFDVASVNNASVLTNGTLTAGTVARLITNAGGYILFTGCEL
jgi:hypothetical protein